MDTSTYAALQTSIAFWEKVAAGKALSKGVRTCALCRLFHPHMNFSRTDCSGCPVAEATGQSFCVGSPYEGYETACDRARTRIAVTVEKAYKASPMTILRDVRSVAAAAQAELLFLKSLVPAGGPDDV